MFYLNHHLPNLYTILIIEDCLKTLTIAFVRLHQYTIIKQGLSLRKHTIYPK